MANILSLPSGSNTTGTVLGTIAGGATVAYLTNAAFMASFAASISMTPLAVAGIAGVVVTGLVNYAATHVAEVRRINSMIAAVDLKTYAPDPDNKLH